MKRIYSAESLVQVVHMQNLLAASGVVTEVRNARLAGALGEIPFMETWPQLWVDDYAESRAKSVVEQELSEQPTQHASWCCRGCNETVEGQFATCWNCGAAAP